MRIITQEKPVFTDVLCPQVGVETARDGFCVSCGATDHEVIADSTGAKAEEVSDMTEVFIGNGPRGRFVTFATRETIERWVAQGYAHEGHEGEPLPHRAEDCEA